MVMSACFRTRIVRLAIEEVLVVLFIIVIFAVEVMCVLSFIIVHTSCLDMVEVTLFCDKKGRVLFV